jgi:signal transduction histidine kinase/DNA-binding response OmpR family regulator/HPt (histidine-containing phosphotransfer) domain-containing protein
MPASIKGFFAKTKKNWAHRPFYAQVLVVALAFALMVILGSYFMTRIVHSHLVNNSEAALDLMQANIASDMQEMETMLDGITETVRIMIVRGDSSEMVSEYILHISNYLIANERIMHYFFSIYGIFDVFDNMFYIGDRWMVPENFIPEDRPWYKAAVEANGRIAITEPYMNVALGVETITYARRIFDDLGNPLGVVCLNMDLERIKEHVLKTYFTENNSGILLSRQLKVLAHTERFFWGKSLRDLDIGVAALADDLEQGKIISERKVKNYRGEASIAFFRQLENGWYIGIITPEAVYFEEIGRMRLTLIVLGTVLAVILSAILIRMIKKQQESDERIQAMYSTTMAKVREANEAKNTIGILKNILNGIDALVYVSVPSSGEILFVNNHLKAHYNLESDCIGQVCYHALQEGMTQRCYFCPCFQLDKDPTNPVVWIEHSTKTRRVYRNTDSYIEWPGSGMVHLQHSIDITELNTAKEEAIQANKAKSNFLARVSHEIRTPMNAILGITEIQLQNEKINPDIQEAFEKVYDSGYLLLSIINDILDLSKIEAGKLELVPIKYDVSSLINDTVHLNIMRFENKPIEFTLEVDEKIPIQLFGDELRIKQILNNLLTNAFKYTENGRVTLSIAAEHMSWNEAGMVTLVFKVTDTGQGMTQEQVDNLFNEYTRFNLEANRETEGTGLGLNITRHLVRLMNGEIFVESKKDKGSMFTVRLPQVTVGSEELGKEMATNLSEFHHSRSKQMERMPQITREYMPYGRVLIVDDVETNLYVAKGLLAPYGLSVETSMNGFDAIDKIRNGSVYDVIYMDHFMPKMDGIETVKNIRSLGYQEPIIALTANALAGQMDMFLANGFDGFISKPIDTRKLNGSLNELIRDKHPPEVIEAARRQKAGMVHKYATSVAPQSLASTQIMDIFVGDAERAVLALEVVSTKNYRRDNDIQMYITNVHAMKSALANIGEMDLADRAKELEQAGREKNIPEMIEKTTEFLAALQKKKKKNKVVESDDDSQAADTNSEDDSHLPQVSMEEQLLIIQKACTDYDKKTAKDALNSLREKSWPRPIREQLETMVRYLLHSEFEKAAEAAANFGSSGIVVEKSKNI